MDKELKFLRYFYEEASNYMGPADCEIYDEIARNYIGEGNKLPDGYERFEEDEPEEEE